MEKTGAYVNEYSPGSSKVFRRMQISKLSVQTYRLAIDKSNTVYASQPSLNQVAIFKQGSSTPKILGTPLDAPGALAIDSAGNLYVGNCGGGHFTIDVFEPGNFSLLRSITDTTCPLDLAIDAQNNVYAANYDGTIPVFKAGSNTLLYDLDNEGSTKNVRIAIDPMGYVYVASESAPAFNNGAILIYPPRSQKVVREVSNALRAIGSLRVDASRNLFVGSLAGFVNEYPYGQSKPSRTINIVPYQAVDITTDLGGNLYVVNFGGNSGYVTAYVPGSTTPRKIATDITAPTAVITGTH